MPLTLSRRGRHRAPVERKVKFASAAAYLAGVAGVAVLQALAGDTQLLTGLPDAVEVLVVPLLPAAAAFAAGWRARHTPRLPAPASGAGSFIPRGPGPTGRGTARVWPAP